MMFDFEGAIAKLKEFKVDCEETAKNAEREGLTEIAEMNWKNAKSFDELAEKIKIVFEKEKQ